MKDFVSHKGVKYPMGNYLRYDHLSPSYQCYIAATSSIYEPTTYSEAITDPRWIEAMQAEIQALESNKTWEITDLPPGKKPIGCRWIYKVKYKSTGEVERFKARLVAKGYSQIEGIDYKETFSPVVKMVTVRAIVSLAASKHWHIHQMDVFNAFLHGDLEDEIYMQLPQGFVSQGEKVCRLTKSLYGLKQAPRQWNHKLTEALIELRFKQSQYDHSLFINKSEAGTVIVLVYVDDMLVTGSSLKLIVETKEALQKAFKMKDLGELKYFLGIEFTRSADGILMHQRKYILELITNMGMSAAKPAGTPIDVNVKLTSRQYDEQVESKRIYEDPLVDQIMYQKLVGKLLYLNMTRPDISFSTQTLSQFLQQPKKSHMDAALRVVRYLKGHPGQGLLFGSSSNNLITAFCDADWASCPLTRRSVTGYAVKIGESLVSWKAKKQTTVSKSSAEAEYRSLASTVSELVWLLGMLKEVGAEVQLPVQIYSDSKAAIQIAANPVYHERTKHIEIDCHFIRERLQQGMILINYIPTQEQPADVLTKGLCKLQHEYLLSKLGVLDIFAPPSLKGSNEI